MTNPARSITLTLMMCVSIGAATAMFITPALPSISDYFDVSPNTAQGIIGWYLFGFMLGQLPYAYLSNRYGRVFALQMGLLLNLIGGIVCLLSAYHMSFYGLLGGRILSSLGTSAGLICSFTLISEYYDAQKAKVIFSYTVIAFTLGEGISVSLGGLVTQYLGWLTCFICLIVYGALVLVLSYRLPETVVQTTPGHKPKHSLYRSYLNELAHPFVSGFALIMGIGTAIVYIYAASGPLIAYQFLQLKPAAFGIWNFLNSIAMLFAGLCSARMVKNYTGRQLIALGITAMIFGGSMLILLYTTASKNVFLFFSASAILSFGPPMTFPSASAYATNFAHDKATGSSVINFINLAIGMCAVFAIACFPGNIYRQFLSVTFILIIINGLTLIRLQPEKTHCPPQQTPHMH